MAVLLGFLDYGRDPAASTRPSPRQLLPPSPLRPFVFFVRAFVECGSTMTMLA